MRFAAAAAGLIESIGICIAFLLALFTGREEHLLL